LPEDLVEGKENWKVPKIKASVGPNLRGWWKIDQRKFGTKIGGKEVPQRKKTNAYCRGGT